MNVLVVAPMEKEYEYFYKAISNRAHRVNSYKLIQAGIGKVDSAVSVGLELYSPTITFDLVAVIGFAAGSSIFNQGDLVVPGSVRYHDTRVPQGLVPPLEKVYNLQGNDEVVCLTGDSFVDAELANELIKTHGKNVIFDMEGAAIAQVCDDLNKPLIMLKIISDIPQEEGLESFESFVENHPDFTIFLDYLETLS